MAIKIKDLTNEQLVEEFENSIIETVKKAMSNIGTKALDIRIEKMKEEILQRF